jgi:hypothetical protein
VLKISLPNPMPRKTTMDHPSVFNALARRFSGNRPNSRITNQPPTKAPPIIIQYRGSLAVMTTVKSSIPPM